ncbi:hypothetical protein [Aeromicrobium sp. UC242_57]
MPPRPSISKLSVADGDGARDPAQMLIVPVGLAGQEDLVDVLLV